MAMIHFPVPFFEHFLSDASHETLPWLANVHPRYGDRFLKFGIAREISATAETRVVSSAAIEPDWMGLDIGPRTVAVYRAAVEARQ